MNRQPDRMNLEVLLPFGVFSRDDSVTRIVVEAQSGSFGILPRRLDCVAALVPGILTYEVEGQDEVYVAVDEGVLVKTGALVRLSVRRALIGDDLAQLRAAVEQEFKKLDVREQGLRAVMAKLETGVLRRLAAVEHD